MGLSIIEYVLFLIWFLWIGQAAFGMRNVYMFYRREKKKREQENSHKGEVEPYSPNAVVMVPVKGADPKLGEHMQGLLEQAYPLFRLIFTTESVDDEAYKAIRDYVGVGYVERDLPGGEGTYLEWADVSGLSASKGLKKIQLVDAGYAQKEAQKVHNQIAGMELFEDGDKAVVFADADAVMGNQWLGRIIAPLVSPQVGCTTAWRWLVPENGGRANIATRFACIINSSIVTLMGRDRRNCAWGGSMAALRSTLEDIDMPKPWRGTFNDDVNLSNAVNEMGRRVYLVPNMLVKGPVTFHWGSLMEFGRRQYMHARVYQPVSWRVGVFGTSLYMTGFLSAIGSLFAFESVTWSFALATLITVYVLDVMRGRYRKQVVKHSLDRDAFEALKGVWRLEYALTPVWMFVHWLFCVTSGLGRHFKWGGITYRINSPRDIDIIDRSV